MALHVKSITDYYEKDEFNNLCIPFNFNKNVNQKFRYHDDVTEKFIFELAESYLIRGCKPDGFFVKRASKNIYKMYFFDGKMIFMTIVVEKS